MAVLIAIFCVWHEPLLRTCGRWLDVGQSPAECDYAMVMMGDEETRPFVAAALFKAGLASNCVVARLRFIETQRDALGSQPHEVIQKILASQGVPSENVHQLPESCDSTRDEIVSLGKFMDRHPSARVAVVTSNYHTRRTRWTLRRLLDDQQVARIQMISAPTDDFNADNWWLHDKGFSHYTSEFIKFGIYVCRDGIGFWLVLLGAVASVFFFRYVW